MEVSIEISDGNISNVSILFLNLNIDFQDPECLADGTGHENPAGRLSFLPPPPDRPAGTAGVLSRLDNVATGD